MPGPRSRLTVELVLTEAERAELERWQRATTVAHGLVQRGRIILLLADGLPVSEAARRVGVQRRIARKWGERFLARRLDGLTDLPRPGRPPAFPPLVTAELVQRACALPDQAGRSLAVWDCRELARQLIADGVVPAISVETVRRRLGRLPLKPWRVHYWLTPKRPRDAAFYAIVKELCDLYTRGLVPGEVVLSVDEKTSLQPRPRLHPTRPPRGKRPVLVEHEYRRDGATHLFAAFDTRRGTVVGQCHRRKRAAEFLAFLAHLDEQFGPEVARVHLVVDNLRTHKTAAVQAWLAAHPRFEVQFTPVHCSWLNQVEQWFGIVQRKRLRIADFASLAELEAKLAQFIAEWNTHAHPFRWTPASFTKVLAAQPPAAAPEPPVVIAPAPPLPAAA